MIWVPCSQCSCSCDELPVGQKAFLWDAPDGTPTVMEGVQMYVTIIHALLLCISLH